MRRYARKKKWDFVLLTDAFFETEHFANIEFLVPHVGLLAINLDYSIRRSKLLDYLKQLKKVKIKHLLKQVSENEEDRQKNEQVLWRLLLIRQIQTDYFKLINLESIVW
jgi:hypothetical protein